MAGYPVHGRISALITSATSRRRARLGHVIRYIGRPGAMGGKSTPLRELDASTIQSRSRHLPVFAMVRQPEYSSLFHQRAQPPARWGRPYLVVPAEVISLSPRTAEPPILSSPC
jgi:hypothetical protein